MKKMNKKGFTLIEMLVVIAIIAVLVAIVIPTVGSATEKAKEAADAANIRSAVAEVTTKGLTTTGTVSPVVVELKQTGAFDANPDLAGGKIAGYEVSQFANMKKVTVSWDATNQAVVVTPSAE